MNLKLLLVLGLLLWCSPAFALTDCWRSGGSLEIWLEWNPGLLVTGFSLGDAYPEEDFNEIIHMFIPNAGPTRFSTNAVNP